MKLQAKQEMAGRVWRRLARGPSLRLPITFQIDHKLLELEPRQLRAIEQEFERQVRIWIASWIVGDLKQLLTKRFRPIFEWGKVGKSGERKEAGDGNNNQHAG